MTVSHSEIVQWASAYIQAQQEPSPLQEDHPLWWAVEKFMLLGNIEDAEECWVGILEVLSQKPPKEVTGMLAAGPLQDLIEYFGLQFIDRIELEAQRSDAFRDLLGGVWESGPPEVWTRVQGVRGEP